MPTITKQIAVAYQDGAYLGGTRLSNGYQLNGTYGVDPITRGGFVLFSAITIPTNATITTAEIDMYWRKTSIGNSLHPLITFVADSASNFGPASVLTQPYLSKTYTGYPGGFPFGGGVVGTATTTFTDPQSKQTFNVKPLVLELLKKYTYNNNTMLFYLGGNPQATITGNETISFYDFERGSSGTGEKVPKLTITYTIPEPVTPQSLTKDNKAYQRGNQVFIFE